MDELEGLEGLDELDAAEELVCPSSDEEEEEALPVLLDKRIEELEELDELEEETDEATDEELAFPVLDTRSSTQLTPVTLAGSVRSTSEHASKESNRAQLRPWIASCIFNCLLRAKTTE